MNHPATAMLGLGRMGSALAGALADAGVPLTVWNRTPARAYALEGRARIARSAADACANAELVVLSLSDYSAGIEVMDEVAEHIELADKTLVQLTSGSPADARTMDAWAGMHGMHYLDAAIVAYPNGVGTAQAVLFYAGDEARYERYRPTLATLGGVNQFVGEAIGAAATLDCAVLEYYYGATLSMLHGAALCESEQLPLNLYFQTVKAVAPLLNATADSARSMIDRELYSGIDCALSTHLAALRHIQRLSHDNEVDTRLPDVLMAAYKKAVAAGHGDDEIAAVFEVLRRSGD
ncbi:MAG: NAD(P)-dependent oxidoreductase [Gammaproteobacteria bacterium]|nr:NAD(P)-dependent oxidoreductase [Gammaproteobacteria bacterium]